MEIQGVEIIMYDIMNRASERFVVDKWFHFFFISRDVDIAGVGTCTVNNFFVDSGFSFKKFQGNSFEELMLTISIPRASDRSSLQGTFHSSSPFVKALEK